MPQASTLVEDVWATLRRIRVTVFTVGLGARQVQHLQPLHVGAPCLSLLSHLTTCR
jgi:hypothetical protein